MTNHQGPNSQINPHPRPVHPAGFTLIEVLIVVGIIVILTGLVLAGVLAAKKRGNYIRIQSDLALIANALEAYKSDNYGQYPVFADPSADQASTTANIAGNGTWLDYFVVPGSPGGARGAVLLCRALIGPGPAGTNAIANPGDDGADGPGFRVRRNINSATGQFSGKVYGYYVDPAKFKISYLTPPNAYANFPMAYPVMLDINGNPILYYPAAAGNPPTNVLYNNPQTTTNVTSRFNGYDNEYFLDAQTPVNPPTIPNPPLQTLAAQCGTPPYLLWTAGADGVFGLDANGKSDDITNFDLPANLKK